MILYCEQSNIYCPGYKQYICIGNKFVVLRFLLTSIKINKDLTLFLFVQDSRKVSKNI